MLNLKSGIEIRGYRCFEVASKAGMSESRLSRIITGRAKATHDEMERLSAILDISIVWLFRSPELPGRTVAPLAESEACA